MNPSEHLHPGAVTIAAIQARVSARFKLDIGHMRSGWQTREIARPRQIAMYLSKHVAGRSLKVIGREFSRDHATVYHACRNIARLRLSDPAIAAAVDELTAELSG